MTTTLLAVTGLSPAILTETLWALARESPGVLPHRVRILTTVTGAEIIENQLFTARPEWGGKTTWETLRSHLRARGDELIAEPCAVIPMADGDSGRAIPLDDIRTPAENAAAAEFIFNRVWETVRDPNQGLIASIAGGRKTMGALLHSAVSLIGRETDRVTHVLVNPPYDSLPGFFFPTQPAGPLVSRDGRAYDPSDATIHLADVPFVPLRNRFGELDELPASFISLKNSLSERLKRDAERAVMLRIDHVRGTLSVDGESISIRPRALAILHFILRCNERNLVPPDQATAAEAFNKRVAANPSEYGQPSIRGIGAEDIRRELNHLRDLLRRTAWQPAARTLRQPPFMLELS